MYKKSVCASCGAEIVINIVAQPDGGHDEFWICPECDNNNKEIYNNEGDLIATEWYNPIQDVDYRVDYRLADNNLFCRNEQGEWVKVKD